MPSPFPTSRITPPAGRAEASVATSRRQACSASRSEPGPSHSPRFSQPGATARKKSGPMLSYTRAAGFPPCFSTPAACRACWAVQPAIHAGLAAISHPPSTGGFPATGLTTRHWIHRDGSACRRRNTRTCQQGHAHRPRQQPGVCGQVLALLVARSPGTRCRTTRPAASTCRPALSPVRPSRIIPGPGMPATGPDSSGETQHGPAAEAARTLGGTAAQVAADLAGYSDRVPPAYRTGSIRRWAHCVAELVGVIAWCGRGWGS